MKNIKNILIIILILLLAFAGWRYVTDTSKLDKKYNTELKLSEALGDSVEYFQTKEGEWVAEKRTLQADINVLQKENYNLSDNQVRLINTIKRLNKEWAGEKEIWAAARIEYEALIDSLDEVIATAAEIDTINNIVRFVQTDTAAHFIYDLDVYGVRPYPEEIIPEMRFNKVDFPNEQTIMFQWDKNERKDYPISFSILNTNKYYKVLNVDSYVIPGIQKGVVDPTGGQKVWRWFKVNGKYILIGAAGYTIGALSVK